MDALLRRPMAEPVPASRPEFAKRLSPEVSRRFQPLDRSGRFLFTGNGAVSAAVCADVMRGQGLGLVIGSPE